MPEQTLDTNAALKLMRKPFAEHQISKMCKPTKKDNPPGRCNACGGFHKLPSVQLSYVGHAALTDRLLDADPCWTWEPLSFAPDGSPFLDANGGLWIKLTVAGVTRLGYGDAQGKVGGDAMKERIGDALRNAAMRFGAALDLWHKGDLHPEISEEPAATFEKQQDGSFAKPVQKTDSPKPATRKKKESIPGAGKPWGGEFEVSVSKPPDASKGELPAAAALVVTKTDALPATNIHGLDIKDEEIPFPGDPSPTASNPAPEPKPVTDRLATDEERTGFQKRLVALRDKGYDGPALRQYLMKNSGVPKIASSNEISFLKFTELAARLEQEEKNGTLKALLEAK